MTASHFLGWAIPVKETTVVGYFIYFHNSYFFPVTEIKLFSVTEC